MHKYKTLTDSVDAIRDIMTGNWYLAEFAADDSVLRETDAVYRTVDDAEYAFEAGEAGWIDA